MIRSNQFGIEPGTYECNGVHVVVSTIVTHADNGDGGLSAIDPMVVFRFLNQSTTLHQATGMVISKFKEKYKHV